MNSDISDVSVAALNTKGAFRVWLKTLPASQMIYPDALTDRAKYAFWRFYTPYHPWVRDTVTSWGLVRHAGRQDYLLGTIAPDLSVPEFILYLVRERGFGNHFAAWKDEGELIGLRFVKDFKYQYHLRVFHDREVRVHYEYTPEYRLVAHMKETDMEFRRDEFLNILGNRIVPAAQEAVVV